MIRIRIAKDVARIFDKRVLKSAACAEKRHTVGPRKPNGAQSTLQAFVRTARHAPQTVEAMQLVTWFPAQSHRRKPSRLDSAGTQRCRGQFERAWNRGMCQDLRVIVANQSNPNGAHNRSLSQSILLPME